jgi:drug/metabolite transporter (DMT)-like permease
VAALARRWGNCRWRHHCRLERKTEINVMVNFNPALLLIFPAILFSTTGELFFKMGMNRIGGFEFSSAALKQVLPRIIRSPFMSRVPLSLAYPILALSYLVVVVEAWLFLHERVTLQRFLGVVVIVIGVVIVGLSEG